MEACSHAVMQSCSHAVMQSSEIGTLLWNTRSFHPHEPMHVCMMSTVFHVNCNNFPGARPCRTSNLPLNPSPSVWFLVSPPDQAFVEAYMAAASHTCILQLHVPVVHVWEIDGFNAPLDDLFMTQSASDHAMCMGAHSTHS